jgi:hypothetical protein
MSTPAPPPPPDFKVYKPPSGSSSVLGEGQHDKILAALLIVIAQRIYRMSTSPRQLQTLKLPKQLWPLGLRLLSMHHSNCVRHERRKSSQREIDGQRYYNLLDLRSHLYSHVREQTLIRIKFMDGTQLEKSFPSTNKIRLVYAFVRGCLREDVQPIKFILCANPHIRSVSDNAHQIQINPLNAT